ncbi:rCG28074, isoform CRA_b [Rattus norvegicus]|uniref:Prolactin-induced protein n=1 Tax=Rattus norvegicus TaxID=10116 RepID=A6IF61_RAT|nr:rCG28074, isoform CRA_b [Rattus norvegicus]
MASLQILYQPQAVIHVLILCLILEIASGQDNRVKISTEDNPNIKYLSAKATYTACICTIHNFFWDIHVSANTVLQGKAEVVPDKDICPDGENIFPVTSYVETVTSKILVMP